MKLSHPFIQLPLSFDAQAMAAEITALGESAWKPHPQGFAGNSMLPLLAVDGDADNESFVGPMRPTPELSRCPYLTQVIASLGASVGRTRLMRLAGQAEVKLHADQGYYWAERVRVHIPVITQDSVRFECGGVTIHMAAGECWIFDTWRLHRVHNDAARSRIHLVVDTVGGHDFWQCVAQGRTSHDDAHGWAPRHVTLDPGVVADFDCERCNVPAVLSPWELKSLFGFVFGETLPHPDLALVQTIASLFVRDWRGLWATYGESPDGFASYRQRLQAFVSEVESPARHLMLANTLSWADAVEWMIVRYAIGADAPVASGDGDAGSRLPLPTTRAQLSNG